MKRIAILCAILLVVLAAIGMADEKKARPSANPLIGFDQSFGPKAGWTLGGNYSKLKTALENEFGATVEVNDTGWFNIGKYDVFIIPTPYASAASSQDIASLKAYVQNGGCVVVIWHTLCNQGCTGNPDPDTKWPGESFHDQFFESWVGINMFASFASSADIVSFSEGFGTTPNSVSRVQGIKGARLNQAMAGPVFIGRNAQGQPIAGFKENIGTGKGKVFIIGMPYAFQNALIDQAGNKNFLFNIIADCLDDNGGGGGGGGGGGLFIKKVKGKPKVLTPGDDMKLIIVVGNNSNSASTATTAQFYISTNTAIDGADVFVGSIAIPAVNPGKKIKQKITVLVPNVAENFYYIVAKLVSTGEEKESKKQVEIVP